MVLKNILVGDYEIDQDDLFLVGDTILKEKGLVDHQLSSCSEFYAVGLSQIIEQVFEINMTLYDIKRNDADKDIDHLDVNVNFSNVVISKPTMINYSSGKEEILFPNVALMKEKTYKSVLRVDVNIKVTAFMKNGFTEVKEDTVKEFKICKIPIMVKSKWCNTYGLSKESLTQLHEDPTDNGGYFIIRGVEWVIDCVENILFNKVRIFRNEGYKKEIMRAEFIAKPGDFYLNSDQFIIRWLNDGQITIEIRREKLKDIKMPFYLLFRMMGWVTDKQIFDNILLGYDTPVSKNMMQYIKNAFNAKYANLPNGRYIYTQHDVLQYIAEEIKDTAFPYLDMDINPENYQKITNFLLDNFDIHFLQHMGTTMASRERKLRFLCILIRKIFLVHLENMEPTDRDSYNSKRIHAAGTSYAKSFKTNFNASIVQYMSRKLKKDLKTLSFSQIDLASTIKSSVFGMDFERAIMQSITAGNKSQIIINNRPLKNRLASQLLNRKNQLSVLSTLRQVTATSIDSAKQSDRASEMRRVHMSFLGYICVTHSPEGEKVGVNKQLAMFAFVTQASFSEVIKDILLDDEEIYPLDETDYKDIEELNLCNVYVNGNWIGCCKDALYIAQKYRQKRREFAISPEITIVWDNTQDEVYFWTDVGRVIRPLLIVYNNQRDSSYFPTVKKSKKAQPFFQGLAITKTHIELLYAKKLTMEDLLKANIVELISAEEQENMYLAPDFDTLRENQKNELCEYTHCDIPQSMFGITALTSPYADHNQAQRIVYQTSQSKQTCGVFAKNWPYRADKDTFLQYHNEMPLVKTVANRYLSPNGSNCIVAIACNTGFNIEDSIIFNQGAVDRGLFNGSKFTFYKTEIEQREEFANPDITTTTDIKSACYDKLTNGIIKVGTIVNKNDAIIGKVMKITKNVDDNFQFADRSVIYKESEQAIVYNVIVDRNEEDERFCKVVLRKLRPVANGDKFSVRGSSQVMTDIGWMEIKDLDITKHKVATLTLDGNLDYVVPSGLSSYDYDGDMYSLKTRQLEMFVTANHKLYVKQHNHSHFGLLTTGQVFGNRVKFKKWANNIYPDQEYYNAKDVDGNITSYSMDAWLKIIGAWFTDGRMMVTDIEDFILIDNCMRLGKSRISEACTELDIEYYISSNNIKIHSEDSPCMWNEFKLIGSNKEDRRLPLFIWTLSVQQSQILLEALIEGNTHTYWNINMQYKTSNLGLANDIMRLALHCGWHGHIILLQDMEYVCKISIIDNEPEINHPRITEQKEEYIYYTGKVFCLEIPDTHQHVYYSRESSLSTAIFTGNSSRSGQKGTVGLLMRDSDMPSTENGIKPSIIINPHSIPSRMTIGQLLESLVGGLCAAKCAQVDATIFKKIDLEAIATELEDLGLNRYGYSRLYNGITGEYIDTEIFMGPTYYQRLQKFTIDTIYSIGSGPSDAITYQPLDGGKLNGKGLRVGEMERDVLAAHGGGKLIAEKYFNHSDAYTEYVCRCGKSAVVNIAKGIYKCNYCKNDAQIAAYPTSWSSKLLIQELESMNIGIRRMPEPFTYSISDDKIFEEIEDGRDN